ncbi:MAG: tetratricopeptide repeat protein [Salibacteraceae bacterium]
MISSNKHYITGRKKFEAQDFEGALADYTKCIQEEENPNVYSERGVVLFYLKRLDLSLDDMNYAADLEPENPYRYSSRAFIKDAMGDVEGAIEDYERAVALDPEDSIAFNNLGLLQEKLGYADQSKQNFKKADEIANIDELLEKIRKEQKAGQSPENESEEGSSFPTEDRSSLSILALLRDTFTTKSGFKDYIRFLRNGLKS